MTIERGPPTVRLSLPVCLCVAVVVTLGSCKLSQGPAPALPSTTPTAVAPQPSEVPSERDRILQEILDYQKRTGEGIESLAAALHQGEVGPPPLEQDVDVARTLLRSAQDAANDQSRDKLLSLLHRLGPALRAVESDLPAVQVMRYLERALVNSQRYSGQEAINLVSSLLFSARKTCQNSPFATLVPNVDAELKRAKEDADNGRLDSVLPQIRKIIQQAAGHPSVALMASCRASVRGAEEACMRGAWRVVQAELEQLDSELRKLEAEVRPVAAAPVESPPATEQAAPVGGGAGEQAGAVPQAPVPQGPAAGAQQPPTGGEQPPAQAPAQAGPRSWQ